MANENLEEKFISHKALLILSASVISGLLMLVISMFLSIQTKQDTTIASLTKICEDNSKDISAIKQAITDMKDQKKETSFIYPFLPADTAKNKRVAFINTKQ